MARICGLPQAVLQDAEALHARMVETARDMVNGDENPEALNKRLLHRLMSLRYAKLDENGRKYHLLISLKWYIAFRRQLQHIRKHFVMD
jgi:hypothetical protein